MKIVFSLAMLAISAFANAASPAAEAALKKESAIDAAANTKSQQKPSPTVGAGVEADSINPMTGTTASYEKLSQKLRLRTLEAKIAEQELALTKSSFDAKQVGAAAAPIRTPSPLPESIKARNAPLPTPKPSAQAKVKGTSKGVASTGAQLPVSIPPAAPERPRYVGMSQSGGRPVALISVGGRTRQVEEGSNEGGMMVTQVSANAAVINGVRTPIEQGISTIQLPESKHSVQPGSQLGQPVPARGVLVPGVNSAAVQPVAPGTPLSMANTSPVSFPPQLYKQ